MLALAYLILLLGAERGKLKHERGIFCLSAPTGEVSQENRTKN
jgi:hypothetical protein